MRRGPETYSSSTSALAPRMEAMSMSSDLVLRRRTGTLTPPAQWYVSIRSIDSLRWQACSARPGWERGICPDEDSRWCRFCLGDLGGLEEEKDAWDASGDDGEAEEAVPVPSDEVLAH